MKKILLIAVAAVMVTSMSAQKGEMFLSGSLGLDIDPATSVDGKKGTYDNSDKTSFAIAPSFTYFLSDRFAIGGQVGLSFESRTYYKTDGSGDKADPQPDDASSTTFSIAPYARYYFVEAGDFKVFCQARVGLSFPKDEFNLGIGISPGVQYKISEKFSIEASLATVSGLSGGVGDLLGLSYTSNSDAKTSKTNFGLNLNNYIPQISFNFHF